MAKSPKPETCPCGQAHAVAIYDGKPDDSREYAVPLEVHAFRTCTEAQEWLEHNVHHNMNVTVVGISTHVRHFQEWLDRFNDKS